MIIAVLSQIQLTFLLIEVIIDLFSGNCSYHDNAFVASRALHIVNLLNSSATFPLLEHFFKYQVRISSIYSISFSGSKSTFEFTIM